MTYAEKTLKKQSILKSSCLDTPLGAMIAIADDDSLYLLEFVDRRGFEFEIAQMRKKLTTAIMPGSTPAIKSIEKELKQYFNGKLKDFNTPLSLIGSPFQKQVWTQLRKVPYGKTCSYADLAKAIDRPTAFRAVANANGANRFPIVIPCHRVINSNGELGGYGGGIARKKWLIHHEEAV